MVSNILPRIYSHSKRWLTVCRSYTEHYGNRGTEYDPSMEPSQYHRDRFEYRDSDY